MIAGAGAQLMTKQHSLQSAQTPGLPTPLGAFNITQLADRPDKVGKDTLLPGLAVHEDVVYCTKGSGGKGVNGVYFVDTIGRACLNGVGLPVPGAALPTTPPTRGPRGGADDRAAHQHAHPQGLPDCAEAHDVRPVRHLVANATTLYVADEGNGTSTGSPTTNAYTAAAVQTRAGLQQWVLTGGTWTLADTLQSGLALGAPYAVSRYPSGTNRTTGLPWAPATDGLRNVAGRINRDGSATIWAITSTVSGAIDTRADPNRLATVTDPPAAPNPGAGFSTVRTAVAKEWTTKAADAPDPPEVAPRRSTPGGVTGCLPASPDQPAAVREDKCPARGRKSET